MRLVACSRLKPPFYIPLRDPRKSPRRDVTCYVSKAGGLKCAGGKTPSWAFNLSGLDSTPPTRERCALPRGGDAQRWSGELCPRRLQQGQRRPLARSRGRAGITWL